MTNVWLPPIVASDIMTKKVVSVGPETPTRTVARLLMENSFSAIPVVDENGAPVGMISEGDLIRREIDRRAPRRAWWLELLAEGEDLAAEFVDYLKAADRPARDIMTAPVVTPRVGEIPECKSCGAAAEAAGSRQEQAAALTTPLEWAACSATALSIQRGSATT